MKEVFKFIWDAIKTYKLYYFIMVLAPMLGAFYKPLVYYAMKLMVDIITNVNGFNFHQLILPLCIYFFSDLSLIFIWRGSDIACWKSEPYVKRGILLNALDKVLALKYIFFLNTSSGSITSKIKGMFDGYSNIWMQFYYGLSYWIFASITTGVSVFWVSYKLGFIISAWALLFVSINLAFARKINNLSHLANEAKHTIIGEVADNISNVQSIKYYTSRRYEYKALFNSISDNYIPKEIKALKFHFKVNLFNDISGILTFMIMLLAMLYLKQINQITTGDFVFVFGMVFQFQENLWHLMQEFHKLTDQTGDLKSSLSLYKGGEVEYNELKTIDEIKTNSTIDKITVASSIEFKNLFFKHDGNKQIFNNLNLQIKAGERVGVVGYTGAGKSTLINLLLKVFKQQQGQILINNVDISTIDNDNLRGLISIIPQDVNLFHRSLLNNIRYGNLEASDDEVFVASQKAYVDEFVDNLPDKYDTLVGERGVKLSGGQRQRIAIARAI